MPPMARTVYAIATADTKGAELAYLAQAARKAGAEVITVDVGTRNPPQIPTDGPAWPWWPRHS